MWTNCQGIYKDHGDTKYVGEWHNNKRNGQGSCWYPDGCKYVGQFQDDKPSGQGTFMCPDGTKYTGELLDGKLDGQGAYTFPSGDKYVGQFQDDKFNGQGTAYAHNGSVIWSGIWSNDGFVGPVGTHPDTPAPSGHNEIALVKDEGTFKVPVLINGVIVLHFTVDSGASDVSIPADVVTTLMRTGTRSDDFLGTQIYQMADGSTVPSKTFRIRSLKVGDKVIENVTGSMANVEGSFLLGQSFLSRFGGCRSTVARHDRALRRHRRRSWLDAERAGRIAVDAITPRAS